MSQNQLRVLLLFVLTDLYQAFLAELQSTEPRVFSLNLKRHSFLKVQFLYPDVNPTSGSRSGSGSGSSFPRHSCMIVMLHKECQWLFTRIFFSRFLLFPPPPPKKKVIISHLLKMPLYKCKTRKVIKCFLLLWSFCLELTATALYKCYNYRHLHVHSKKFYLFNSPRI